MKWFYFLTLNKQKFNARKIQDQNFNNKTVKQILQNINVWFTYYFFKNLYSIYSNISKWAGDVSQSDRSMLIYIKSADW